MTPQQILDTLRTNLNCWAAVVMQPNKDKTEMLCVTTSNLPNDWTQAKNMLDGKSMNSKCYLQNQRVINNNENFSKPKGAKTTHKIYAAAVVPIQRQGTVIGTLELLSDAESVIFEESELLLMEKAAMKLSKMI